MTTGLFITLFVVVLNNGCLLRTTAAHGERLDDENVQKRGPNTYASLRREQQFRQNVAARKQRWAYNTEERRMFNRRDQLSALPGSLARVATVKNHLGKATGAVKHNRKSADNNDVWVYDREVPKGALPENENYRRPSIKLFRPRKMEDNQNKAEPASRQSQRKSSADTWERQGRLLLSQNKAIEQNSKRGQQNKQALDELTRMANVAKDEKQRVMNLKNSESTLLLAQIQKSLQHQIEMKNSVSEHMSKTRLLQERIRSRLSEQTQVIKFQQDLINKLYSNTQSFKLNQEKLSAGISDYGQTKQSLRNVSDQVSELLLKSQRLSDIISSMAKQTEEELKATKHKFEKTRQSNGDFHENLSTHVQENDMALQIHLNHSQRMMMELESRIQRLHKLNATSYILRQDLEQQTGRIDQLSKTTHGHDEAFKTVEQMINTVYDHVQKLKLQKADQGSFVALQDKIKEVEAKNHDLREKLSMQRSTVQRLNAFNIQKLKNMTNKLEKKVSKNEFQSLHQAADMYSDELDQMNQKHRDLNALVSSLKERIRNVSQYLVKNMSSLSQKESKLTATQLQSISQLRALLDVENSTMHHVENDVGQDRKQIARIAKNLGELSGLVAQFELTGQKQMKGLSDNIERAANEEEFRENSLLSKLDTMANKVKHQKQLLNELATSSATGLATILKNVRRLKEQLTTEEQSLSQKGIEIARNNITIIRNKGRLGSLENVATGMLNDISRISTRLQKNNESVQSQLAKSLQNQVDISNSLQEQKELVKEETKRITDVTNEQHAEAMLELINIKEKLDEESYKWSSNLHTEMENVADSINNASLGILELKEKNVEFLQLLATMKKYIQRQKQDEESDMNSFAEKMMSLSEKLNNQRMAADNEAIGAQSRMQAIESNLRAISEMQNNQTNMQSMLDAENTQLNKVRADVHSQAHSFERHLTQLAKNVEKGVNKALMTKASEVELGELKLSIDDLKVSEDNLALEFLKQNATFSDIQTSIIKKMSTINAIVKEKASSLEVDSLKNIMNMEHDQLEHLGGRIDSKIKNLSWALNSYSKDINSVLKEKESDFKKHLIFSTGLSDSIENLENSLLSMEERLNLAKRFENETKAMLLEQIAGDQRRIDDLVTVQNKLRKVIPSLSKQSDVDALDKIINSTIENIQNNENYMTLNFDTMSKKLEKQRSLLTTLAEESASGFSSLLAKLGSENITIDKLKGLLERRAEEIEANKNNMDRNKNKIEANQALAKSNQAKIKDDEEAIAHANTRIDSTNKKLTSTDEEIEKMKLKMTSDELVSKNEGNEILQLESREQQLESKETDMEKMLESDDNIISQLESKEQEEEDRITETNAALQAVKGKAEMNEKKEEATEAKVLKNDASISANSKRINANSKIIFNHTADLKKQGKILFEHESKIGKEASLIESQGRDISHFMEGKAQEFINALTTENSEDVNYLIEFGARNDGMLVSGLFKVIDEVKLDDISICVKMKIFNLNGRRNIFSLGVKQGSYYQIFLKMIFVMSSNIIDQILLKHSEATQVIRLSLEKGEKQHVFCFNRNRFFVNKREFQFNSELYFSRYLKEGMSIVLGYNDLSNSMNNPVTIAGFDALTANGFEGVVNDVSMWGESMEGWYKHRANLLQDFGCSWNNPEGKKIVDFEKNVITGSKVYGTTNIRLDDECRSMSEREEATDNNHGLSLKNVKENQLIERGEDTMEAALPKSDLSDHSLGFIQEKHVLIDQRPTGPQPDAGNLESMKQTKDLRSKWFRPMYRTESSDEGVALTTESKDPANQDIMNEEEVEVHLPMTTLQEEGVSFKDEDQIIESEEEVEAHLPEETVHDDGGISFRDEDHNNTEREEEISAELPPTDLGDDGSAFTDEKHNITSSEEVDNVTLPPSDVSIDDGVGFLKENRSYTIKPEEFVDATLPSFTIDDGQGFLVEDHTNFTSEEELTNVTLKADLANDTDKSFSSEKHDGIKNDEELQNVTLPDVDLKAEDGSTFTSEKRSYAIADESELANVSLPAVILDDDNSKTFSMETHNVTSEEESANVTLPAADTDDKGKSFQEEDHSNFTAMDEEAANVTLPNADLSAEAGVAFLDEKRNYTIESEEERDNVTLTGNTTIDEGTSYSQEKHNVTSEEEVAVTLPPSNVSGVEGMRFSAENHTGLVMEEENDNVTLGPAVPNSDDGEGFRSENRTYSIADEAEVEVQLATDAPEVAQKSYLNEDHSSLETEEERDVTLAPSELKGDNGLSFKEEKHTDIPVEENVDAHLPNDDIEEKGVGFIQSHIVSETAANDDETDVEKITPPSASDKIEFAQEVESKDGAKKKPETSGVEDGAKSVDFAREITGIGKETAWRKDDETELFADETKPKTTKRRWRFTTPSTQTLVEETTAHGRTAKEIVAKKKAATKEADPMTKLANDLRDLDLLVDSMAGA